MISPHYVQARLGIPRSDGDSRANKQAGHTSRLFMLMKPWALKVIFVSRFARSSPGQAHHQLHPSICPASRQQNCRDSSAGTFSDSCNDVWDCRLLVYPNRQVVKLSAALSVWHATVFTRRSVPVSLLAKIWFWNVLSCRLWLVHIWSAGRKAGRKEATLTRRLENIVCLGCQLITFTVAQLFVPACP